MLVTRTNFQSVLGILSRYPKRSLDTETTGLRPYHGSRLFSIIISVAAPEAPPEAFYFNFQPYEGLPPDQILRQAHLLQMQTLFEQPHVLWFLHNAKYDLAILGAQGLLLKGTIHCTKAMARIEYNEHPTYDLASCAARIGFAKDDTVEKHILEHGLWEWETIPGKKQRKKNLHYDAVPFDIIRPYGEIDANITYRLGESQEASFAAVDAQQLKLPPRAKQRNIVENERALTQVVFRMEERGVLINRSYTHRAQKYEADRAEKALASFKAETGRDFIASSKLFAEVFASEKDKFFYTEKGNPSFDATVFATFEHPAAQHVLTYRDAKSKFDFYAGFLYHADSHGVLHPNFNPDGTRTGRFSSSDPNFQNLTAEEGQEDQEFLVRRAIIPRPGFIFLMPDYDQMEYRMMLDYAEEMALIEKIKGGLDVHTATGELMGVPRGQAKTINFMLLYGGGTAKLCLALFKPSVGEVPLKEIAMRFLYGKTVESPTAFAPEIVEYNLGELQKAAALKKLYFSTLPGVERFVESVKEAVQIRGFIRNWAGRRCYYPNTQFDYTGPNTLIQGGTADVNKFGLVEIDKYLASMRSKLVLTIHDENPIEAHEDEAEEVARHVKEIMEVVYPYKHLPLTVGMEWSAKSLGDKRKGFPGGRCAAARTFDSAGNIACQGSGAS